MDALADRYEIRAELGQGGMAVVYLAHDHKHDRPVALKVVRPELRLSLGPARFLREIQIAARLTHPNILPLYDSGEVGGTLFYAMPFLEGESLRDLLNREGQLPVADAIRIARQVADALAYAHSMGVVHRDIKPENIVVGPWGEVLLLDWGLAKVWDRVKEIHPSGEKTDPEDKSLTAQGPLQATPLYMSPEQIAEAKDLDHRTDIYSLGAVLFELLTLEHLAWGETLDEMLDNTQNRPAPAPSSVSPNREIPSLLETICLRCVQKDPDYRIQNVKELIHELLYWRRIHVMRRPET